MPLQAENNILRRRKHVHELEMLVNHTDSQRVCILRGANDHFSAVNEDLPLIREINTGEHVHKRSLSAAVLPKQRYDLSPADVQ